MKTTRIYALITAAALLFTSCQTVPQNSQTSETASEVFAQNSNTEDKYMPQNYDYIKAMWLSQYDMQSIYTDGGSQRGFASFTALAEKILSNISESGYNTVVIQLRPFADSFYPSDLFPPSAFVTGTYALDFSYDPLAVLIKIAHKKGLSVHAWINPLRAMTDAQIQLVDDSYKIKSWYNSSETKGKFIVKSGTGAAERWYLNPCYSETRRLVADGAAEIVQKYDVDGIHMDDYFYPTKDSGFDAHAFGLYKTGGGTLALDDFRRETISLMVKEIHDKIKEINPDVMFGISPAGILNTTYNDLYADAPRWCAEKGYIDYIVPQIYFGLEHQNYDFVSVYKTWQALKKHSELKFCFGISLGKAFSGTDNYAGTGKNEWSEHNDILKRCLEFAREQNDASGLFMFCYQYYFDPLTGEDVTKTKNERENLAPVFANIES